jgi:hypothetical protein
MSHDFPFTGHGSVGEDFKALKKDIEEDAMPPLRYLLLHWDARLSTKEKQMILDWVSESTQMLLQ